MKGIIWCKFSGDGGKQLDKIMNDYLRLNFELRHRSGPPSTAVFSNGDVWEVRRATDSSRGVSCNISYISYDIAPEEIDTIINPATKASPYQAFYYYNP